MGVLAPGSAHARPSLSPPLILAEIFRRTCKFRSCPWGPSVPRHETPISVSVNLGLFFFLFHILFTKKGLSLASEILHGLCNQQILGFHSVWTNLMGVSGGGFKEPGVADAVALSLLNFCYTKVALHLHSLWPDIIH